jgi:hypothetical protein
LILNIEMELEFFLLLIEKLKVSRHLKKLLIKIEGIKDDIWGLDEFFLENLVCEP